MAFLTDYKDKREMEEFVLRVVGSYMRSSGFTQRKVTDTPTDNLSVVNRLYVTLNGNVANRPLSSVATVGQPYYATDTFIPMTFSDQGWRNGVGSIVAGHI
jgi:hypothetical protein